MMRVQLTLLLILLLGAINMAGAAERPYLRGADEIATLHAGWTDENRARAREKWARYLQLSDEELWALLPAPQIYRSMGVNKTEGCPNCGQEAYKAGGLWPFKCDIFAAPWKVRCPSCGEVFPKNDFAAFYASGLDERGYFDPERADRSLLFNTEHPDPNDPLHMYAVDDGTGWVDAEGHRFWFIARYCGFLWIQVTRDVQAMAADYQRSGEPALAHAAALLLARKADLEPDLNFTEQGVHPGTYKLGGDKGKAIWACGPYSEAARMRALLAAYDDLWEPIGEDTALVEFLTRKCADIGHPEWAGSADAVRRHIERELIAEGARDVIRTRAEGSTRYGGDVGHMCWTLALQGLVVDDPDLKAELLAWPFQGPYPLKGGMHEVLCGPILGREGAGGSSSPGYSRTHYTMARTLADIYAKIDGPEHRDLYGKYPCIQRSYDSQFLLNCCERYYPHIGDCGKCGSPGLICNAAIMLEAFEKFGAPRYARMAYFLNHHSTSGFSADVAARVQAIVDEQGDWRQTSTNLNGYGLAILRSGEAVEDQRAAWLYYGRAVTNSHSHDDRLNIGLFAKGLNLMPDMGYPERTGAWPKRGAWTSNTISHNTVVVDRLRQKRVTVGNMQVFVETPMVRLVDVAREAVYPQTSLYRRAYALVDIDESDSYLVDIFRVKGGAEHHYSFHSAEGEVETEELALEPQPTGTLAGPDVEFASLYPKTLRWNDPGIGFDYLRDVRRDDSPPDAWSVTWKVKDTWNTRRQGRRAETDVRLRLTMLGPHDEVIIATAEPPRLG
ncbi:MAG: heparinase II/III family protein, partial [Armatimonadetes bacterium]|nr:heparinase II/III family protein [Armatimonadota bacterium]